eukprot:comp22933_c0_seq1/m.36330 comp22933_c0_seq1/g.36330  ORF comp22933_c0_seq1/g.36330 comp22933_c0_seq1/m.36330 type:complete len:1363 (-) comp22933_c0_seq1:376-4464(-)
MTVAVNISAKPKAPVLATLLAAQYAGDAVAVTINWAHSDGPTTTVDGVTITGDVDLARYVARLAPSSGLYPANPIQATQVDHWVDVCRGDLSSKEFNKFEAALKSLNAAVTGKVALVGTVTSLADVVVYAALKGNAVFGNLVKKGTAQANFPEVVRWFSAVEALPQTQAAAAASVPPKAEKKAEGTTTVDKGGIAKQEDAKFMLLPGAEMGKVVVRFPPEASGYLHIGHAKAALLNHIYATEYKGTLIFRFDDTNPVKEKEHFEEVILEDVKLLGITYDKFSYTSDYFDLMLELAEKLIKEGKAYVDDTPVDKMREERSACVESPSRSNTIEQNLALWEEMKKGSEKGVQCALRAKIDMKHLNGCMRDPVLYRCNATPHLRTKDKYKLYPTYDFACPIVDSVEGVTHALRTNEYRDRQEQYEWLCAALEIRCPVVYDYSRLNMTYTLMSKRKLTWFVENGTVKGWDDPRFPTVRGILRHGLTVEGLKQFILSQGSSRSNNLMEWDKIWAINKKVIDPIAKRFTALDKSKAVTVTLSGGPATAYSESVALHKKNPELGSRPFWFGSEIMIEGDDAQALEDNEEVTLMDWGNAIVTKITREGDRVKAVDMKLHLEGDFKKTKKKLTWLAAVPENLGGDCVEFDFLITKEKLEDEDNFEDFINPNTEFHTSMVGEPALASLKKGDIIQLQRRGYYIVDVPHSDSTTLTLFNIPDGHQKNMSSLSSKAPPAAARRDKPTSSTSTSAASSRTASNAPTPMPTPSPSTSGLSAQDLDGRIAAQGEKIRALKSAKADAAAVTAEVNALLALKVEYKAATGQDWKPAGGAPAARQEKPKAEKAEKPKEKKEPKPKAEKPKKEEKKDEAGKTKLAMQASKEGNFADWYAELITKAELIEYHDVSGCYVFRPASFSIWEYVQAFLDTSFKSLGVQNCYFPMFVTQKALQKEKDHIADFAPEVAWVTKAGNSEMAEPVAIRPTSETVMYPYFAKWVQSHRDLPILLNQWCNVVRWEFKHPQPFLRTREFLWQEGHTAHATQAEAEKEVLQILDFYTRAYGELLAVPVVKGKKTEKEKFAGALFTTTIEAYIPGSGRAIQAATSHCLGQNFSKMFDIVFQDPSDPTKKLNAWQNSWGFTTRSIGVMIMVHGDDKGLVLPPRVASTQVVIIPCGVTGSTSQEDREKLYAHIDGICKTLKAAGVRAETDCRENYTTGWKFAHWEQKGIPVRMEVGPRDMQAGNVVCVVRHNGDKSTLPAADLAKSMPALLDTVHSQLYQKAKDQLDRHVKVVEKWDDFVPALDAKCLCLIPYCQNKACEEDIKKRSTRDEAVDSNAPAMGAKSLCIPFEQPGDVTGKPCVQCGQPAVNYTLFGRSY